MNDKKNASTSNNKARAIVVGAGISGLHTASILLAQGIDVLVLEARDRIGGRILTDHSDGDNIGLAFMVRVYFKDYRMSGAAWMHGASHEPLVKLISRLKIDYYYDDGSPLYFTEFGPTGTQFKARNVADEFIDYLNYWNQKNSNGPDISADSHIRQFARSYELISEDDRIWAPEALRIVENTLGLASEEISSKFLNEMLPPQRDLCINGGYDKVLNFIVRPVADRPGTLMLNKCISNIQWDRSGPVAPVAVHGYSTDTGDSFTYECDEIVITVPLGVLHRGDINFEPTLSQTITTDLSKLSYGALGKTIFESDDVFWSKQNDSLIYFPTPPSLSDDSEIHKYPVLSHCFIATNFWVMTGAKKLCILLSPPVVGQIEAMEPDEESLFTYFEPLLELFRAEPYEALPSMVKATVTNWLNDKYIGFGTYSTAKVGYDPRILWDALESHKDLRLQFAGEHCSRTGTGCVHGAYKTGDVAAANVLRILTVNGKGG